MKLRVSDLQSASDLDSIRNSCDVFFFTKMRVSCTFERSAGVQFAENEMIRGTIPSLLPFFQVCHFFYEVLLKK